ncbi:voltage-dependent anion channel [Microdochium bolleyi]|uniref:Voltage-dependent anion channel n=1 Tax=Microdochium bolleyi TaxID=196109 RepID=A0A136IVI9_9PEZI|nr:voltage-dependent anion channel [Microdochium bolleyi]
MTDVDLDEKDPDHDLEKGKGQDHGKGHDHGHGHVDVNDPNRPRYGLKQRLHHFTWAWFTTTMSAGGLSLLIFAQPFQFPGLRQIGLAVYIINLVIFAILNACLIGRFIIHTGDLSKSLTHPREGFFVPTYFLSIATLITSTQRYAIPDNDINLVWAIKTAYWGYVAITLMLAIGQFSYVFSAHSFGLHTMMPTWILPIFPVMLSGTIASIIAETQPAIDALPIIVAGLTCQGLGISVAFMMYAHMIGRLMQAGLPNREHRPGLYMNVGPPAFTATAVIGMANGLPDDFDMMVAGISAKPLIQVWALVTGIFLWALALWWFGVATIAVIRSPPKYFHLGWWAMVFPNTGWILSTIAIGKALNSNGVLYAATGMSVVLLIMFFFVGYHLVRAVMIQDIMYPGRDEDVNDH